MLSLFLKRFGYILDHDSNFKIENNTDTIGVEILRNLLNKNSVLLKEYSFYELLKYCHKFYTEYLKDPGIKEASAEDLEQILNKLDSTEHEKEIGSIPPEKIAVMGHEFSKIGNAFCNKLYKEKIKRGIITIDDLELMTVKPLERKSKYCKRVFGQLGLLAYRRISRHKSSTRINFNKAHLSKKWMLLCG